MTASQPCSSFSLLDSLPFFLLLPVQLIKTASCVLIEFWSEPWYRNRGHRSPNKVTTRAIIIMSATNMHIETVSSPTNIACIKYWGKADKVFNTPINSSVSVTLDQHDLRSITSVAASKSFIADRLWLNGSELQMDDLDKNPHANRFRTCVNEMRKLARDRIDPKTGEVTVKASEWSEYHIHVVSKNTFPTAAGLASSAAGYACLVFALANLFNVPLDNKGLGDLSVIARQGSGSACRSLFGGFVRWQMGTAANGWKDSRAIPIASREDWPELETLILVANDAKKDTSSTAGMEQSVKTSPLLAFRAREVVDERLSRIEKAFKVFRIILLSMDYIF